MALTKDEQNKRMAIGVLLMYPTFLTFAVIDVVVAPIRFFNDRVKNEDGDSITDILRDSFKL